MYLGPRISIKDLRLSNVHPNSGGGKVFSANRINPSADPPNVNSEIMCFAKIKRMHVPEAPSRPLSFVASRRADSQSQDAGGGTILNGGVCCLPELDMTPGRNISYTLLSTTSPVESRIRHAVHFTYHRQMACSEDWVQRVQPKRLGRTFKIRSLLPLPGYVHTLFQSRCFLVQVAMIPERRLRLIIGGRHAEEGRAPGPRNFKLCPDLPLPDLH
ncbi:hypothetical protein GB937_001207 [Aspergillus fischeri]|nr:hypothetical protein GB937_001207 [Aspergillus fischeri]